MERLTFEGLFCDISQCSDTPGGSFCEDGMCSQRATWERLKTYENTGLTPEQIQEAVDLLKSSFYDADIPNELISWVERCTWHVRKCHELRTQLDKYEALGTVDELTEMKSRLREMTPEHNPCEGCKFYNQPYWSIVSPCQGCPLA